MNNFDPMTGKPLNNNNQNNGGQNGQYNQNGYNPNYNQNYNQNYSQGYSQNNNSGHDQNDFDKTNSYRPNNSGYTQPNQGYNYQNNGYNPQNNGYNNQYNNGYNNPYNGGYGYQQPQGNGRLPIQNRSIVMYILLSIVTCGIFALYWMACVNDDVNNSLGENDTSGGMVVLLSIVTCGIYGLFWAYSLGNKISRIKRMMGDPYAESSLSVLYLVLAIFTTYIVPLAIAQNELNKYAGING